MQLRYFLAKNSNRKYVQHAILYIYVAILVASCEFIQNNVSQINSLFTNLIIIHSPVSVHIMGVNSLMLMHHLRSRFLGVAIKM